MNAANQAAHTCLDEEAPPTPPGTDDTLEQIQTQLLDMKKEEDGLVEEYRLRDKSFMCDHKLYQVLINKNTDCIHSEMDPRKKEMLNTLFTLAFDYERLYSKYLLLRDMHL